MSNGIIGGVSNKGNNEKNPVISVDKLKDPISKIAENTRATNTLDPGGNLGVDVGKKGSVV